MPLQQCRLVAVLPLSLEGGIGFLNFGPVVLTPGVQNGHGQVGQGHSVQARQVGDVGEILVHFRGELQNKLAIGLAFGRRPRLTEMGEGPLA